LEAIFVVHVVRPFRSHRPTEIVSAPKTYAFDTGFVCYHRGWRELRREDVGLLREHFVFVERSVRRRHGDISARFVGLPMLIEGALRPSELRADR